MQKEYTLQSDTYTVNTYAMYISKISWNNINTQNTKTEVTSGRLRKLSGKIDDTGKVDRRSVRSHVVRAWPIKSAWDIGRSLLSQDNASNIRGNQRWIQCQESSSLASAERIVKKDKLRDEKFLTEANKSAWCGRRGQTTQA